MVDAIELNVLGRFTARRAGALLPERVVGARKARTLLKLLIVDGGLVATDRIVDVLWGDEPPPKARQNVASLVSRLRGWLGADAIEGSTAGYRLAGDGVRVDVREAARLTDEAEARLAADEPAIALAAAGEALALFAAGPLLADEPDAPWADEARRAAERLRRRARRAGWLAALATGDVAGALDLAGAAVASDPLDEEAYRALMLAHHRAGEPARGLAEYARLRHVLVEELGADPGPETEALYLAILRGEQLPPVAPAPEPRRAVTPALDPTFVGRRAELAMVLDAWRDAVEGRPSLTLLVGEAGIGKTRLASELAAAAETTGGLVVQARCYEAERSLFLQPVAEAVRSIATRLAPDELRDAVADRAGTLGDLVPEVAAVLRPLDYVRAPAELERRRAFDAVLALFRRLARRRPVLLVLDDIHHAGAATVELLHFFVRSLGADRVQVVATVRPDEGVDVIAQLEDVARAIELGPLADVDVAQLADAMGARQAADRVARLARGHPFYTVEALRAFVEGGSIESASVPASLRSAVLTRVRRAGADVEELLRGAVIVGAAFRVDDVAQLVGLEVHEAARRAERALAARLLVEVGPAYEFANDLVREVLYETTPAPTRAARHRMAAALVRDNPEAVAFHAATAGDWAAAVEAYEAAAARAVAAFANRDAERLLGLALEAAAHVDDAAAEARIRLARGRAREQLAEHQGAHDDHAVALELSRSLGDAHLEAIASERLGWNAWWARDAHAADELAAQAAELAEQAAASPFARPGALVLAGRMRHWRGDLDGAEHALRDAVGSEADAATAIHATYALGAVLVHRDRPDEAIRILEQVVPSAERAGAFRILLSAVFFDAVAHAHVGAFGVARDLLVRKQRLLDEFDVPFYRPRTATTLAWVAWELGDLGQAEQLAAAAVEHAERAESRLGAGPLHERAHALLAAAEVAHLQGDDATAFDRLAAVGPLLGRDLPFEWRWELRLLELRSRLEPEQAGALYDKAQARHCARYEALALGHLGRRDEAAAVAHAVGSDLLLAEVGPLGEARAALDRVTARLPSSLRDGFAARGRVPTLVASRGRARAGH